MRLEEAHTKGAKSGLYGLTRETIHNDLTPVPTQSDVQYMQNAGNIVFILPILMVNCEGNFGFVNS